MFGKLKEKLVEKAFGFAFMRYDKDNTGMLDKDQITSLINDVFQLIKIPRQVSWMETMLLMKMFDSDGSQGITKDEAYEACKNALAKFGGIGGIAKMAGFGKTSSGLPQEEDQYSHIPKQEIDQEEQIAGKTSGKLDFNPPEDIDISMLDKLPPPGQNLKPDDLKTHKQIETQPPQKEQLKPAKKEQLKPEKSKEKAKQKSSQKKQGGQKKQQKGNPQGQGHGHGKGKGKKDEEGGFLL